MPTKNNQPPDPFDTDEASHFMARDPTTAPLRLQPRHQKMIVTSDGEFVTAYKGVVVQWQLLYKSSTPRFQMCQMCHSFVREVDVGYQAVHNLKEYALHLECVPLIFPFQISSARKSDYRHWLRDKRPPHLTALLEKILNESKHPPVGPDQLPENLTSLQGMLPRPDLQDEEA
jgi:hypothetical protein